MLGLLVNIGITALLIAGIAYILYRGLSSLGSGLKFTAQTVMHGYGSQDRRHAIEEVQFVEEDELREDAGPDSFGTRGPVKEQTSTGSTR